jgi:hypothetical protein
MRYVDPQRLLRKTIPIVSSGYLLATGRDHVFSTTISMWNRRQFDLWEIIRCAARGEIFAPAPRTMVDLANELRGGDPIEISS